MSSERSCAPSSSASSARSSSASARLAAACAPGGRGDRQAPTPRAEQPTRLQGRNERPVLLWRERRGRAPRVRARDRQLPRSQPMTQCLSLSLAAWPGDLTSAVVQHDAVDVTVSRRPAPCTGCLPPAWRCAGRRPLRGRGPRHLSSAWTWQQARRVPGHAPQAACADQPAPARALHKPPRGRPTLLLLRAMTHTLLHRRRPPRAHLAVADLGGQLCARHVRVGDRLLQRLRERGRSALGRIVGGRGRGGCGRAAVCVRAERAAGLSRRRRRAALPAHGGRLHCESGKHALIRHTSQETDGCPGPKTGLPVATHLCSEQGTQASMAQPATPSSVPQDSIGPHMPTQRLQRGCKSAREQRNANECRKRPGRAGARARASCASSSSMRARNCATRSTCARAARSPRPGCRLNRRAAPDPHTTEPRADGQAVTLAVLRSRSGYSRTGYRTHGVVPGPHPQQPHEPRCTGVPRRRAEARHAVVRGGAGGARLRAPERPAVQALRGGRLQRGVLLGRARQQAPLHLAVVAQHALRAGRARCQGQGRVVRATSQPRSARWTASLESLRLCAAERTTQGRRWHRHQGHPAEATAPGRPMRRRKLASGLIEHWTVYFHAVADLQAGDLARLVR